MPEAATANAPLPSKTLQWRLWELTYYMRRFVLSFSIVPQTVCASIWSLVSRSYQILCIWALTVVEVVAVVIVNSAFCLFYRAVDL